MKVQHLGYACESIESALAYLRSMYSIESVSKIVFDEIQDANVCLVKTCEHDYFLELVCGDKVKHLAQSGIRFYHTCYEVDNIDVAIADFTKNGAIQIGEPQPAVLFSGRKIVFLQTDFGLIELLQSAAAAEVSVVEQYDTKDLTVFVGSSFCARPIVLQAESKSKELELNWAWLNKSYAEMFDLLLSPKESGGKLFYILCVRVIDWIDATASSESVLANFVDFIEQLHGLLQSSFANTQHELQIYLCPSDCAAELAADLEAKLLVTLRSVPGVECFNYSSWLSDADFERCFDVYADAAANVPYTPYFDSVLINSVIKNILFKIRKPIKVVVLDCDNTLWRGVCSEDDVSDLKVDGSFLQLQEYVLRLREHGIILCICSKNNIRDVFKVFDQHPDMILHSSDITIFKVSWRSKSEQIIEMSNELDMALDSFMIVDDSPVECAKIAAQCPEALVVPFINAGIDAAAMFNKLKIDDLLLAAPEVNRQEFYESFEQRKQLLAKASSFSDLHKMLAIKIEIAGYDKNVITRVAELSRRTNQFNLTGIGFTCEQLDLLLPDKRMLLQAKVSDRFSDYGLVAAIIYNVASDRLLVENFYVSCRAFGTGVEFKLLESLINLHKSAIVAFKFVGTGRNLMGQEFLNSLPLADKNIADGYTYYNYKSADLLGVIKSLGKKTISQMDRFAIPGQRLAVPLYNKALLQVLNADHIYNQSNANYDDVAHDKNIAVDNLSNNHVLTVFREQLGLATLGLDDNIFEHGASSLDALRILSGIAKHTKQHLKFVSIIDNPTARQIFLCLSRDDKNISNTSMAELNYDVSSNIVAVNQAEMFFIDKIYGASWFYNIPISITVGGSFDYQAMVFAFTQVMQRHDSLRSEFKLTASGLNRVINTTAQPVVNNIDAASISAHNLNELVRQHELEQFALDGAPLCKMNIYRQGNDKAILLFVFAHIIFDGGSREIFLKEIKYFYELKAYAKSGAVCPALTHNYSHFCAWQADLLNSNFADTANEYWIAELNNPPILKLPWHKATKSSSDFKGRYFRFEIDAELQSLVEHIKSVESISANNIFLAAYFILLHKLTLDADLLIATPVSTRSRNEFNALIGDFVNTLAIRVKFDSSSLLADVLRRVAKAVIGALDYRDIPFSKVKASVNSQSKTADSTFGALFSYLEEYSLDNWLQGLDSSVYNDGYNAARFDLVMEIVQRDNVWFGGLYVPEILESSAVEGIITAYKSILGSMSELSELKVSDIVLLPRHQQDQLCAEICSKIDNTPAQDFRMLLDEQLRADNTNVALNINGSCIAYSELMLYIENFKAKLVREYQLKAADKVVVILSPGLELITTLLASCYLNLIYIPFDPDSSADYITSMLSDLRPDLVVAQNSCCDLAMSLGVRFCSEDSVIYLDDNLNSISTDYQSGACFYVLHTSGSTGKPKGVMVSFANISCLIRDMRSLYSMSTKDSVPWVHSPTFDVSMWEVLGTLCAGATLHVLQRLQARSPEFIAQTCDSLGHSVLCQTPSAFNNLLEYLLINTSFDLSHLRYVIFTGEKLERNSIRKWFDIFPDSVAKFYDMYGITEVAVYSTFQDAKADCLLNKCVVGNPLNSEAVMVLDANKNILPCYFPGELCMLGGGVALGYLNRSDLTAEKFFTINRTNAYKTGDVGRKIAGNLTEYLCRDDSQVKVDGYRVDLNMIKDALLEHAAVSDVSVNVCQFENGQKQIVAAVIPDHARAIFVWRYADLYLRGELQQFNWTTLDCGLEVAYHNRPELAALYSELFIEDVYAQDNIVVNDGDCIFDVGANIGLYSLKLATTFNHLKIYAFEPLPDVYSILSMNLQIYSEKALCFCCALGANNEMQTINYYPAASVLSGISATVSENEGLIETYLDNKLADSTELLTAEQKSLLTESRLQCESVQCQVRRISDYIADYSIDCINLLKIDVENFEWEVLQGVDPEHWRLIQQIVIEVHDHDNRLRRVLSFLEERGFSVTYSVGDNLQDTGLYNVYAKSRSYKVTDNKSKASNINEFASRKELTNILRQYLRNFLPDYMLPKHFCYFTSLPLNKNGKLDHSRLTDFSSTTTKAINNTPRAAMSLAACNLQAEIYALWQEILCISEFNTNDNFFDLGGSSLLLVRLFAALTERYPHLKLADLFRYSTVISLADFLGNDIKPQDKLPLFNHKSCVTDNKIAIVGMAGSFPGADNVEQLWDKISTGAVMLNEFTDAELASFGVAASVREKPNFVPVCGVVSGLDQFDAKLFGISDIEAERMDPQHRLFLQAAYTAVESAGCDIASCPDKVGVYAGCGDSGYDLVQRYNEEHKFSQAALLRQLGNDKDFLANKVAYYFNCKGPALNINTGSSTGLVCVINACEALAAGAIDIALAGASAAILPQHTGYLYEPGSIYSQRGACCPFDVKSDGTVPSSAVAVVVLKRLQDAVAAGDNIVAVISGYAQNNDGSDKVGFTAPSVSGQVSCMQQALQRADLTSDAIDYIEAHGTGTKLGDMLEIEALSSVYKQPATDVIPKIGSVKANIGHAQAAAGMVGLIKLACMAAHKQLVPLANYSELSARLSDNYADAASAFAYDKINTNLNSFTGAINSLAMGGTNAHLILSSYAETNKRSLGDTNNIALQQRPQVLPYSAVDAAGLISLLESHNNYLQSLSTSKLNCAQNFINYAYTMQSGRRSLQQRIVFTAASLQELRELIAAYVATREQTDQSQTDITAWLAWQTGAVRPEPDPLLQQYASKISLPTYPFSKTRFWGVQTTSDHKTAESRQHQATDIELTSDWLLKTCCDILDVSVVDLARPITEQGADSLSVLTLADELYKKFSKTISLEVIQSISLREIVLNLVKPEEVSVARVVKLKPGAESLSPLVIIHPGFGELDAYQPMLELLAIERPVIGIENLLMNDLNNRFSSIVEFAEHYIKLANLATYADPVFLGWSFGGAVAYEMAQQLQQQTASVPRVIMLDSWVGLSNSTIASLMHDWGGASLDKNSLWWNLLYARACLLGAYKPAMSKSEVLLCVSREISSAYLQNKPNLGWDTCMVSGFQLTSIPGCHASALDLENIKYYLKKISDFCLEEEACELE